MTETILAQKRKREDPVLSFKAHGGSVTCVTSSVGNTFATASSSGRIRLWDSSMEPPAKMASVKGHKEAVHTLIFSRDGRLLASACQSGTIIVWIVEKGSLRIRTKISVSTNVWSMAFSPEKMMIACGTGSIVGRVNLYDVSGDEAIFKDSLLVCGEVNCLAFSHDNKTLASACGDSTIQLLDVSGGVLKVEGTLKGHSESVACVAFGPDQQTLVSTGDDRTIKVWDLRTGMLQGTVETKHSEDVNCVTISPDNDILASCSCDNTVKLWKRSGDAFEELDTLRGSSKHPSHNYVYSVAFSPDSNIMIAGMDDGNAMFWKRA